MSAGARGSSRERQLGRMLGDAGWIVYRAAGSHGNADLVALKRGRVPLLVQVKGDRVGPFAHFGPSERHDLMIEARDAGARAFVAWIPTLRALTWFAAPSWAEHPSPL